MAEFSKGDRIVKMSGIAAGKYGTVNSVREDGTLNVTFDGERLSRFCDPERCGKVAANAADSSKRAAYLLKLRDKRRAEADKAWHDLYIKYDGHIPVSEVKKFEASPIGKGREFSAKERAEFDKLFASRNARAANAKFKVGDRVKSAKYPELGEMKVERVFQDIHGTAYRTSRDGFLTDDIHYDRTLIPANARACNRASVFEYGVGDTVKLRSGRTGEVLSKYVDKDGNLSIEINLNGTRYAVSADMVDSVVKNARACNAKFKVGDRVAYYGKDPAIYRKRGKVSDVSQIRGETFVTVDLDDGEEWGAPEKDWSFMNSCARNAVARNGLSPYGAVSGLLALKWYDKKEDKNGGVMIVRAPFEAVKRYLEQSARNYPYKIAPYGRGWAKVTAPFEW